MCKRRLTRRGSRLAVRRTVRSLTRIRWRTPDYLGSALAAFRRAIRARHRLARLAPSFFDSTVVDRERCHRDARLRWMAE